MRNLVSRGSTGCIEDPDTEVREGSPRTVADLLSGIISRYEVFFLVLFLLVFAFLTYAESNEKPLWYDEIFTIIVAGQPTWHAMAQAMPGDGNPPLYALLTRVLIGIFGQSALVIRLPSAIGLLAALVGLFVFIRRECGVIFGLLAVAIVCLEPVSKYAYEARPYGLLLGFMMLGLVSWQSATRAADSARPRRLALMGMVLAIVGSILSHNIGVVEIGIPLLFGEATRIWRTRRTDWPVLATAASAIPALVVTAPMMHRTSTLLLNYSRISLHPLTWQKFMLLWVHRPLQTLPLVLGAHVGANLVWFLVSLIALGWAPRFLNRQLNQAMPATALAPIQSEISPHIIAAALGATLLIPITWVLMMSENGWYFARYGVGSVAGIAILACLFLRRTNLGGSAVPLALLTVLATQFSHPAVDYLRHLPARATPHFSVYTDSSGLPIVIADPLTFLPAWWYAPQSIKTRLVYLKDVDFAKDYDWAIPEVALTSEEPLISANFADYDSFVATQDHFILSIPAGWIPAGWRDGETERLEAAGFRLTAIRDVPGDEIYDVQRVH